MNVKLKTKQIYDEHEEIQEALHENVEVNRLEEKIIIELNNQKIVIDKKECTLEILREKNDILIKQNEEKNLNYETPYGKIKMTTIGEEIQIEENPLKIIVTYKITMNDQIKYKNQIEIVEINSEK